MEITHQYATPLAS